MRSRTARQALPAGGTRSWNHQLPCGEGVLLGQGGTGRGAAGPHVPCGGCWLAVDVSQFRVALAAFSCTHRELCPATSCGSRCLRAGTRTSGCRPEHPWNTRRVSACYLRINWAERQRCCTAGRLAIRTARDAAVVTAAGRRVLCPDTTRPPPGVHGDLRAESGAALRAPGTDDIAALRPGAGGSSRPPGATVRGPGRGRAVSAGTLAALAVLLGAPTASASGHGGDIGPSGHGDTTRAYAPAHAGRAKGAPGPCGVPEAGIVPGVSAVPRVTVAAAGGPVPPAAETAPPRGGGAGGSARADSARTPLLDTSPGTSADTSSGGSVSDPRTSGTSPTPAGGRLGWWPYALAVGLLTGLAVPAARGHTPRPRRSARLTGPVD